MNQRIVKNCFSRPLNIDEYLSVLKDTGHAPAASILFYISSQKMGDEVYFSSELWKTLMSFGKTASDRGINLLIEKGYLIQKTKTTYEARFPTEEEKMKKQFEKEKADYSVYCHIFPNGKRYVGISSNVEQRWNDGKNYEKNTEMWNDIVKYGWSNIEHQIIKEGLTKKEALALERKMIREENLVRDGYNQI